MADENAAPDARAEEIAELKRQMEAVNKRLAELGAAENDGAGAEKGGSASPRPEEEGPDEAVPAPADFAADEPSVQAALPERRSEPSNRPQSASAVHAEPVVEAPSAPGAPVPPPACDASANAPADGKPSACGSDFPAQPTSGDAFPQKENVPAGQDGAQGAQAAAVPPQGEQQAYGQPRPAQPEQPGQVGQQGYQGYQQGQFGQQSYQQQPYQAQNPYGQPYQGYQQNPYASPYQQPIVRTKDHVAAGLLGIFLGVFGIHKFYLGYNTAGFILLGVTILGGIFTFGIASTVAWLIGVIEGIIYLTKSQQEFERIYVFSKREWF